MLNRSGLTLSFCILSAFAGTVSADVIPFEVEEAEKRFDTNPKAYERVDQYCINKKINETCSVPGNLFEGGGVGKCERELKSERDYISLTCTLQNSVTIHRQIPDGEFRYDDSICRSLLKVYSCKEPPIVTDQFCRLKKVDETCTIELTSDGYVPEKFQGVCKINIQEKHYWEHRREYRTATRRILTCDPAQPTPQRVYTEVNTLEKLKQWLRL